MPHSGTVLRCHPSVNKAVTLFLPVIFFIHFFLPVEQLTMALNPMNKGDFKHTAQPSTPGSLWSRFSLKGKTAIISGAGQGIGLSVARAYAEMGANVVLWYHTNTDAPKRAEEIGKEFGVKCKCASHSRSDQRTDRKETTTWKALDWAR